MKTITPTELFFTELDFNPAFDGQLSSVKAAIIANTKVKPLLNDNARLRAALEFYADKKHWFPVGMNDCCKEIHVMDCKNDNVGGERARAALSGKGAG